MTARTLTIVTAVSLALAAFPASSGIVKGQSVGYPTLIVNAKCPPGLAKKNPPCVPPGQAKKAYPDYRPRYDRGDRIYRDYRIIRDLDRYGLREGDLYYLVGREVFRISPETGRVIAFIGLADALLN